MNKYNDDSYAMLLLCSNLSLNKKDDILRPLTIVQWSKIAEKLIGLSLTPKNLLDMSSVQLKKDLSLNEDETLRIQNLLARSGQLGLAITDLSNQGINIITRSDTDYPVILKKKLKKYSPAIIYYAGNLDLIKQKSISVVGSRNIDDKALDFTVKLVKKCCNEGFCVVSGGAKGADTTAENTAINEDCNAITFVADSMSRKIKNIDVRQSIMKNKRLVMSAVHPDASFKSFNAMDRNKYIYTLSDYAIVVSSDYNKGGTWAGAKENIKNNWVPLFVRNDADAPEGNKKLLTEPEASAISIAIVTNESIKISEWFALSSKEKTSQIPLF